MKDTSSQITRMLMNDELSQQSNLDQLFELLYLEVKKIATGQLKKLNPDQALSPTVLVNECYLKLQGSAELNIKNSKHFYCLAAKSMRYYLMDLYKSQFSQKRDGQHTVLSLTKLTQEDPLEIELIELHEALDDLEQIDEDLARIVELRFFWGLSLDEVAVIFEVSKSKIYQKWLMAKSLLINLIKDNE
jgi:RNA polymerase sigma factor (TIGR02999 family)